MASIKRSSGRRPGALEGRLLACICRLSRLGEISVSSAKSRLGRKLLFTHFTDSTAPFLFAAPVQASRAAGPVGRGGGLQVVEHQHPRHEAQRAKQAIRAGEEVARARGRLREGKAADLAHSTCIYSPGGPRIHTGTSAVSCVRR